MFHFKQFSVNHSRSTMKVGTDAVLLGAWMPLPEDCQNILEVGSGCGVISLMLAQRINANITGVDIDEKSVEESKKNAENSLWCHRVQFIQDDILHFAKKTTEKYEAIVSNPPFFENSLKSPYHHHNISKHNVSLTLAALCETVDQLLVEKGCLGVILSTENEEKMEILAKKNRLFPTRKTRVFPTPTKKAHRVLMLFERNEIGYQEDSLIIRDYGYTQEYLQLVKKYILFVIFGAFSLFYSCRQTLSSGDLIFVATADSDFEKSIVEVTKLEDNNLNFTHVGIINVTDTGIFVVEALPEKGVIYSLLSDFQLVNNHIYIGKLTPAYKKFAISALHRACSHLGKGYDYAFDLDNDRYYCSELIYDAYANASNDPTFFETPNMTFKMKETDEILPFWSEYFEKHQLPVPEGKPGINPTGLSLSEKINIRPSMKTVRIKN